MNCPDWRGLLELRERLNGELPDGWSDSVVHLSACPACRLTALRLDPSLVFLAQEPLEVSDADVAEMVGNVRTLRRARQAEEATEEPRRQLGRVAAAAAVVSLMVLFPTLTSRPPGPASPPVGPELVVGSGGLPPRSLLLGEGSAPVIEPLDLPFARIYQLGEEDLSVVMVVDESLDV